MLNQITLVGKLTEDPIVETLESGKQVVKITLAVQRSFKNTDGFYKKDFIRCVLWDKLAINISESCKNGDVVGVIGRLQSQSLEDKNGTRKFVTEVCAEKVTFLSHDKEKAKTPHDRDER